MYDERFKQTHDKQIKQSPALMYTPYWQRATCAAPGIIQDLIDLWFGACSRVHGARAYDAAVSREAYSWQLGADGVEQLRSSAEAFWNLFDCWRCCLEWRRCL